MHRFIFNGYLVCIGEVGLCLSQIFLKSFNRSDGKIKVWPVDDNSITIMAF